MGGTTCWDLSPSLDSACTSPWPNTPSTSPSTTTFTVTKATPLSSIAPSHVWIARPCAKPKQGDFYDPTLQGCNAWVFCANPQGCPHGDKVAPGLSCTLKRIELDSPSIREAMAPGYFQEVFEAPEALVDKSSSGPGSDFVSGLCNVRE